MAKTYSVTVFNSKNRKGVKRVFRSHISVAFRISHTRLAPFDFKDRLIV
jgi:hypothetical protein